MYVTWFKLNHVTFIPSIEFRDITPNFVILFLPVLGKKNTLETFLNKCFIDHIQRCHKDVIL